MIPGQAPVHMSAESLLDEGIAALSDLQTEQQVGIDWCYWAWDRIEPIEDEI